MADAAVFKGFVSSVLREVRDLVDTNKQSLGIAEVMVGEKRKGWQSPALFIYKEPGASQPRVSGRNDAADWDIPIRMVLLYKDTSRSADLEVLEILEETADLLWDNPGVGGAHRIVWRNTPDVAPEQIDDDGAYMTIGVLSPTYQKVLQRAR